MPTAAASARPDDFGPETALREPFPKAAFTGGLALALALTLLFWFTDLDRSVSMAFYNSPGGHWPGRSWGWSSLLYRWGQAPADIVGGLGLAGFGLSFCGQRWRAWRGPGLYLALLLLAGPGLLSNVLAKDLAGRPRPEDTLGFGGSWEFRRPFELGIPGRGVSFISGHASNAWYFLGFVFLLRGRRRAWAAALVLCVGLAMSLARVSQGAHWPSDTLLAGALTFSIAAGLSPLIRWQPRASFFGRRPVVLALAAAALALLCLGVVAFHERHFEGDYLATPGPTHRSLPWRGTGAPAEVAVDLVLLRGPLQVRFDQPQAPGALPLRLDSVFRGQGLPAAREGIVAEPLPAGGQFAPGPGTLAVRFTQALSGPWLATESSTVLGLPSGLGVDARLHAEGGPITIGPLPAGRRVLLSGLAEGAAPPEGFHPFGDTGWLRDGRPPLISLDLESAEVAFAP